MKNPLKMMSSTSTFVAATALSFALAVPAQANDQEITLRSIGNDSINMTGTFVSYSNNIYTVDSNFGLIQVPDLNVECLGEACPRLVSDTQTTTEVENVVWDVSLWGSRRAFTEHVEILAELVERRTDGELTLNISYGGLSPSRENLDGIAAGTFEMAQFCAGYHADKNPSITVLELPFLGVSSMDEERAISQAVYKHPAVVADMARWNATLLMPTPQPQYNILGVGSPPTSLEAFKEMTVRATGGTGAAVAALGGTPVNLPAPDVNAALTNGEINAVAFAPHAHMAFNTIESGVWWTANLNPGTANCPVVVNSDALADLSVSHRLALLSSVEEALDHFIDNYSSSTIAAWDVELSERSIIQLNFSDPILNAIRTEVAGPSAAAWIEEKEALGLPSQELYDLVMTTLEDIRQ